MNDFFQYAFLGRAALAAVFLSLTCGMLSPIIVLRRLSFSADGLAHASLGGLAMGICLVSTAGAPTLATYGVSFVVTCAVAGWIGFLSTRVQSDTAIGACYVAAFALGIVLLSWHRRGSSHLEHYFFGSLLAVTSLEVGLLVALASFISVGVFMTWRWLAMWTFDEELATANGVPVGYLRYALMLCIAATVVVGTRIVGVLLVAALLVLPGAVGTHIATRMGSISGWSILTSILSASIGIGLSNASSLPPGPTIVLIAFSFFSMAFVFQRWRERRLSNTTSSHAYRP